MVKMNPLLLTSCSFKLTAILWDPQLLIHIFFIFLLKCICRIAKKIPFFRWEKGLYFIALNIFLQGRYLFLWSILLFKDITRVIEMQILSQSFFCNRLSSLLSFDEPQLYYSEAMPFTYSVRWQTVVMSVTVFFVLWESISFA